MSRPDLVLAIDQGTTSTRAIVFSIRGEAITTAQKALPQIFPADGWVEHDPEEIWSATVEVCRRVLAEVDSERLGAIGITNQRETAVIWDRKTGKPIHNAIVWQDRRGAPLCRKLVEAGHEPMIQQKTGLLIDSYFSATKIAWLLENVSGARARAENGELAFGTIDSFLLWRLTGGEVHATDSTNASRTMLFDIHRKDWDDGLLKLFGVPKSLLPAVKPNAGVFGTSKTSDDRGGGIGIALPIAGMAGDQQAAVIGQACLNPGMIKSTYGTGCFALLNMGSEAKPSKNRLLTTIAYQLGDRFAYAVEGSIFVAGAAVQWLRDGLKLFHEAGETDSLAKSASNSSNVYLVPAFTGLGAPYWDPEARGAILGLTRDTGIAEVVRSALEAVCYQTQDLMAAMSADGGTRPTALRVDGGMARNDWVLQFLADILQLPVERPHVTETTALGAAFCAALGSGMIADVAAIEAAWKPDRRFVPKMTAAERDRRYAGWQDAVRRIRHETHQDRK
jgi:glycerol kinase